MRRLLFGLSTRSTVLYIIIFTVSATVRHPPSTPSTARHLRPSSASARSFYRLNDSLDGYYAPRTQAVARSWMLHNKHDKNQHEHFRLPSTDCSVFSNHNQITDRSLLLLRATGDKRRLSIFKLTMRASNNIFIYEVLINVFFVRI